MKKVRLTLAAMTIAAVGLFAFNSFKAGSIKGTVMPADGAANAWAMSDTDTLKAAISDGAFEITDVQPGTYRIIIEAKPPYKNAAKDGVTVTEGQVTDVGEIKLEQ